MFNVEITRLPSRFKYMKWYQGAMGTIKSKLYFPISQKNVKKNLL